MQNAKTMTPGLTTNMVGREHQNAPICYLIGVTIMVITPQKPAELARRRAASVKVGKHLEFYSLIIQV